MSENPESADSGNRLQILVQAGVVPSVGDFTPNAKKVINALTETEFQSVLSVRKTILKVVGEDALRQSDECLSFIY